MNNLLFYNPYREHLNRLEAMSTGILSGAAGSFITARHKAMFEKMAKEIDEKNKQRMEMVINMSNSGLHPNYPPEFPYNFS